MFKQKMHLAVAVIMLTFLGCSPMRVTDFSEVTPKINPYVYFSGKTIGQGHFYDRFSRVKSRFKVELDGSVNEQGVLVLNETLNYLDTGKISKRTFFIHKESEDTYRVECTDLVDNGKIQASGNTLKWDYVLKQPIGDSIYHLRFDDWMSLFENEVVLNRAYAYWYGLYVGEVVMTINKAM